MNVERIAAVMHKMAGSVFKGHMLRSIHCLLEVEKEELVLEVFRVVTYPKSQVVTTKHVLYQVCYCTLKGKTKFNGLFFCVRIKRHHNFMLADGSPSALVEKPRME